MGSVVLALYRLAGLDVVVLLSAVECAISGNSSGDVEKTTKTGLTSVALNRKSALGEALFLFRGGVILPQPLHTSSSTTRRRFADEALAFCSLYNGAGAGGLCV